MGFTESSIPNVIGRIAAVTGANGGIGLAAADAMAKPAAQVVMGARDRVKAAARQPEGCASCMPSVPTGIQPDSWRSAPPTPPPRRVGGAGARRSSYPPRVGAAAVATEHPRGRDLGIRMPRLRQALPFRGQSGRPSPRQSRPLGGSPRAFKSGGGTPWSPEVPKEARGGRFPRRLPLDPRVTCQNTANTRTGKDLRHHSPIEMQRACPSGEARPYS